MKFGYFTLLDEFNLSSVIRKSNFIFFSLTACARMVGGTGALFFGGKNNDVHITYSSNCWCSLQHFEFIEYN
jgi:hypothetical protein